MNDVACHIARQAVRALYAEVVLEPKPGLVSLRDNGSHRDMTAATFVKSLFALRHYFAQVAMAGWQRQSFATLQALGVEAEARMLRATGGINTHRGAVFSLGLLCASAGHLAARGQAWTPGALRQTLLQQWGAALAARARQALRQPAVSHGQHVCQRAPLRGANAEAALGFPTLFDTTLPALQQALAQGQPLRAAKVHSLFATMAHLDDTNLAHRGGMQALALVKARSARFLADGSVSQSDWLDRARQLHADLVALHLSPGGSADLLACACWVHAMQQAASPQAAPSHAVRLLQS